MELEKIADLIKSKRKEKNLTQVELAEKLHVTEKAISRWETGRGTPDISLLLPLSNILGVSISEILSGKEDEKSNESIKEIIEYIDISKKRKNMKCLILSIIIYLITLFFYLSYLKEIYSSVHSYMNYAGALVINMIFSISILIANYLITNYYYDKIEDKEKMKKTSYIILLVLYIIMIFNLTIFGRMNGEIRYNLIPFKTIAEYILHFNQFNTDIVIINIFGNIGIFMPIQYFILKIFKLKKFKHIFLIDIILIFIVEFLQFITHTGIFDVDDMLLNLLGMVLIYMFYYIFNKKDKNCISKEIR